MLALCVLLTPLAALSQAPRQTAPEIRKPLIYQVGDDLHINAGGPRPLLQSLDWLQQQYGWVVNYEDPEFSVAPDSQAAASSTNRRRAYAAGADAGGFSVQFNVGAEGSRPPNEEKLLRALVDAYNDSGGSAQFELLKQDDGFAVVGVAVRDASEQYVQQQPILGLSVTLESQKSPAADALALICRQLAEQSRVPVSLQLDEEFRAGAVKVGGAPAPARTMLARVMASLPAKLCWRLLYDANTKAYELKVTRAPTGPQPR